MAPGRQRLAPCTVWTTRVMDRILTLAANLFLITGRPTKTKQNKTKQNVTVHECDDAWVWTMPQFVENGTGE